MPPPSIHWLGCTQHSLAQQGKTGAAIHLPLDQLELVYLPFCLPILPYTTSAGDSNFAAELDKTRPLQYNHTQQSITAHVDQEK